MTDFTIVIGGLGSIFFFLGWCIQQSPQHTHTKVIGYNPHAFPDVNNHEQIERYKNDITQQMYEYEMGALPYRIEYEVLVDRVAVLALIIELSKKHSGKARFEWERADHRKRYAMSYKDFFARFEKTMRQWYKMEDAFWAEFKDIEAARARLDTLQHSYNERMGVDKKTPMPSFHYEWMPELKEIACSNS